MSLGLKGLRQLFLWGPTRVALTLQAPTADQIQTSPFNLWGSQVGAVVIICAFHHCDPGSILGSYMQAKIG